MPSLIGGSQKSGFQKAGFGGCSPVPKKGTKIHSVTFGCSTVPKTERRYIRMFPGTKTGARVHSPKTALSRNRPSFSSRSYSKMHFPTENCIFLPKNTVFGGAHGRTAGNYKRGSGLKMLPTFTRNLTFLLEVVHHVCTPSVAHEVRPCIPLPPVRKIIECEQQTSEKHACPRCRWVARCWPRPMLRATAAQL